MRQRVGVERGDAADVHTGTQRLRAARLRSRVAELAREIRQERAPRKSRAQLADAALDDFRVREVQEQCDEIGERLVERRHVHVGRVGKRRPQTVEQRMRGLVRDDVVTERGGDQPFAQREARRMLAGREVTERKIPGFAAVPRVGPFESERPDHQSKRTIVHRRCRPRDLSSESFPEGGVRQAADRVDHLEMEESVRWRRRESAGEQQVGIVEVERFGSERRRRTIADDLEERSNRSRFEFLVGDVDRRHAADSIRDRRVERVDAQRPEERRLGVALIRLDQRLPRNAIAHLVRRHRGVCFLRSGSAHAATVRLRLRPRSRALNDEARRRSFDDAQGRPAAFGTHHDAASVFRPTGRTWRGTVIRTRTEDDGSAIRLELQTLARPPRQRDRSILGRVDLALR
jgi:hypothetical protein